MRDSYLPVHYLDLGNTFPAVIIFLDLPAMCLYTELSFKEKIATNISQLNAPFSTYIAPESTAAIVSICYFPTCSSI